MVKLNLKMLDEAAVESVFSELGEPKYRAGQLMNWIYGKKTTDIGAITVFSQKLRDEISDRAYIGSMPILESAGSADGTVKLLLGLEQGLSVECVLIPGDDRLTLCVSSQVGCAMGCRFCRTGTMGLIRNLMAHEIVDQFMCAQEHVAPRPITNIVFMGMGEPLKNIDEVSEAIHRLRSLLGFSSRRVTVSTCGVVSNFKRLARISPQVNLAISLNATTDSVRDIVMPVNRRHNLEDLMEACRDYPLDKQRSITFEYVMLGGVNDTEADARRLVRMLKGIRSKVNLIPFNPYDGAEYQAPEQGVVDEFQKILHEGGIRAFIRKSKGSDVSAACGQLWSRAG